MRRSKRTATGDTQAPVYNWMFVDPARTRFMSTVSNASNKHYSTLNVVKTEQQKKDNDFNSSQVASNKTITVDKSEIITSNSDKLVIATEKSNIIPDNVSQTDTSSVITESDISEAKSNLSDTNSLTDQSVTSSVTSLAEGMDSTDSTLDESEGSQYVEYFIRCNGTVLKGRRANKSGSSSRTGSITSTKSSPQSLKEHIKVTHHGSKASLSPSHGSKGSLSPSHGSRRSLATSQSSSFYSSSNTASPASGSSGRSLKTKHSEPMDTGESKRRKQDPELGSSKKKKNRISSFMSIFRLKSKERRNKDAASPKLQPAAPIEPNAIVRPGSSSSLKIPDFSGSRSSLMGAPTTVTLTRSHTFNTTTSKGTRASSEPLSPDSKAKSGSTSSLQVIHRRSTGVKKVSIKKDKNKDSARRKETAIKYFSDTYANTEDIVQRKHRAGKSSKTANGPLKSILKQQDNGDKSIRKDAISYTPVFHQDSYSNRSHELPAKRDPPPVPPKPSYLNASYFPLHSGSTVHKPDTAPNKDTDQSQNQKVGQSSLMSRSACSDDDWPTISFSNSPLARSRSEHSSLPPPGSNPSSSQSDLDLSEIMSTFSSILDLNSNSSSQLSLQSDNGYSSESTTHATRSTYQGARPKSKLKTSVSFGCDRDLKTTVTARPHRKVKEDTDFYRANAERYYGDLGYSSGFPAKEDPFSTAVDRRLSCLNESTSSTETLTEMEEVDTTIVVTTEIEPTFANATPSEHIAKPQQTGNMKASQEGVLSESRIENMFNIADVAISKSAKVHCTVERPVSEYENQEDCTKSDDSGISNIEHTFNLQNPQFSEVLNRPRAPNFITLNSNITPMEFGISKRAPVDMSGLASLEEILWELDPDGNHSFECNTISDDSNDEHSSSAHIAQDKSIEGKCSADTDQSNYISPTMRDVRLNADVTDNAKNNYTAETKINIASESNIKDQKESMSTTGHGTNQDKSSECRAVNQYYVSEMRIDLQSYKNADAELNKNVVSLNTSKTEAINSSEENVNSKHCSEGDNGLSDQALINSVHMNQHHAYSIHGPLPDATPLASHYGEHTICHSSPELSTVPCPDAINACSHIPVSHSSLDGEAGNFNNCNSGVSNHAHNGGFNKGAYGKSAACVKIMVNGTYVVNSSQSEPSLFGLRKSDESANTLCHAFSPPFASTATNTALMTDSGFYDSPPSNTANIAHKRQNLRRQNGVDGRKRVAGNTADVNVNVPEHNSHKAPSNGLTAAGSAETRSSAHSQQLLPRSAQLLLRNTHVTPQSDVFIADNYHRNEQVPATGATQNDGDTTGEMMGLRADKDVSVASSTSKESPVYRARDLTAPTKDVTMASAQTNEMSSRGSKVQKNKDKKAGVKNVQFANNRAKNVKYDTVSTKSYPHIMIAQGTTEKQDSKYKKSHSDSRNKSAKQPRNPIPQKAMKSASCDNTHKSTTKSVAHQTTRDNVHSKPRHPRSNEKSASAIDIIKTNQGFSNDKLTTCKAAKGMNIATSMTERLITAESEKKISAQITDGNQCQNHFRRNLQGVNVSTTRKVLLENKTLSEKYNGNTYGEMDGLSRFKVDPESASAQRKAGSKSRKHFVHFDEKTIEKSSNRQSAARRAASFEYLPVRKTLSRDNEKLNLSFDSQIQVEYYDNIKCNKTNNSKITTDTKDKLQLRGSNDSTNKVVSGQTLDTRRKTSPGVRRTANEDSISHSPNRHVKVAASLPSKISVHYHGNETNQRVKSAENRTSHRITERAFKSTAQLCENKRKDVRSESEGTGKVLSQVGSGDARGISRQNQPLGRPVLCEVITDSNHVGLTSRDTETKVGEDTAISGSNAKSEESSFLRKTASEERLDELLSSLGIVNMSDSKSSDEVKRPTSFPVNALQSSTNNNRSIPLSSINMEISCEEAIKTQAGDTNHTFQECKAEILAGDMMETNVPDNRSSAINAGNSGAIVPSVRAHATSISQDEAFTEETQNSIKHSIKQTMHYHHNITHKDSCHGNTEASYSVQIRESHKTDNSNSHLPQKLDVDELITILKTFNDVSPEHDESTMSKGKKAVSQDSLQNRHKSSSTESLYEQVGPATRDSAETTRDTTETTDSRVSNTENISNQTDSAMSNISHTQSAIRTSSHSTSANASTSSTRENTSLSNCTDGATTQTESTLETGRNQLPRNVQFKNDIKSISKNTSNHADDKSYDNFVITETHPNSVSSLDKPFPPSRTDEQDYSEENKSKSSETDGSLEKRGKCEAVLPRADRKRKQRRRPASLLCCVSKASHVPEPVECRDGHRFQVRPLQHPTTCLHCNQLAHNQASYCTVCKMVVHRKCEGQVGARMRKPEMDI